MHKTRLLIASAHVIVRTALGTLLKAVRDFDVVGEIDLSHLVTTPHQLSPDVFLVELPIGADIGDGLPHVCQTLSPDVLLLEIATNNSSTLRVPANLLASVPHVRILLISTNENATYVRTVFATGVLGYILKSAAQSELCQAVKQIYRGRRFIDPRLKESLSEDFLNPVAAPATQSVKHLSRRELEVLRAVALGFTTREISKEMKLSQKTVQTYRERIYKKLELHTRAGLVHYALARGLLGREN